MNTPYQWSKIVASHWGGTRTGMLVHWPGGIKAKKETRDQFVHVIDYVPTILELTGIPAPTFVNGIQQQPMEGTSFAYTFADAEAPERHTTQYFEIGGNRGISHDGWTAVTKHTWAWSDPREKDALFKDDKWNSTARKIRPQAHDQAQSNPAKLLELQQLFLIER